MVTTPSQAGRLDYQATHYSQVFPVRAGVTPCGCVGPAARTWAYVTCPRCLGVGAATSAEARAREDALEAEAAAAAAD